MFSSVKSKGGSGIPAADADAVKNDDFLLLVFIIPLVLRVNFGTSLFLDLILQHRSNGNGVYSRFR